MKKKCEVCAQCARENNGSMNRNKNGKNEDEFEKNVQTQEEREGERKKDERREKNLGTCI